MSDPRYPIGPWPAPETVGEPELAGALRDLAELPAALSAAVAGLDQAQLDTPYREGGWTVRQIVHHVADSHANAWIRHRLALTEEKPVIRPYSQDRWAELPDSKGAPVTVSLALLAPLHARWVGLLRQLGPEDFGREFVHPEYPDRTFTIARNVHLYAWHGRHHTAQIRALRESRGW
jgi:uncharacterized damage-inducible protein DinB